MPLPKAGRRGAGHPAARFPKMTEHGSCPAIRRAEAWAAAEAWVAVEAWAVEEWVEVEE